MTTNKGIDLTKSRMVWVNVYETADTREVADILDEDDPRERLGCIPVIYVQGVGVKPC